MQEYHCLLTLEGLRAITEQCLHRLEELRAGKPPPPHAPQYVLKSRQRSESLGQTAALKAAQEQGH